MSKEKVFIVLSHKHSLKKGSRSEWEVTEKVEFVNQLRDRHITMSSASADYLNRKMLSGAKYGFDEYSKFEDYIRTKYPKQMSQLDAAYRAEQLVPTTAVSPDVMVDEHGNVQVKTIVDQAVAG